MSRLHLVVGPNGAGKTTFVETFLAPALPGLPFVNADVIARTMHPDQPEAHSYEAARIADRTRIALIDSGRSLIAETVFSHPSKLDIIDRAHAASFAVHLHVVMVPVRLSVARVPARVRAGGHAVPEDKIRTRFDRLWPLVSTAALRADTATFYDNSMNTGPRFVVRLTNGLPTGTVAWPAWAPAILPTTFPPTHE